MIYRHGACINNKGHGTFKYTAVLRNVQVVNTFTMCIVYIHAAQRRMFQCNDQACEPKCRAQTQDFGMIQKKNKKDILSGFQGIKEDVGESPDGGS